MEDYNLPYQEGRDERRKKTERNVKIVSQPSS
jgi:hypothetical protein